MAALALLILAATGLYTAVCAFSPFRPCRRCGGYGRSVTRHRRPKRACRRCRGTGLRIRLGRAVFNHFARTYRAGHPARPAAPRTGAAPAPRKEHP